MSYSDDSLLGLDAPEPLAPPDALAEDGQPLSAAENLFAFFGSLVANFARRTHAGAGPAFFDDGSLSARFSDLRRLTD